MLPLFGDFYNGKKIVCTVSQQESAMIGEVDTLGLHQMKGEINIQDIGLLLHYTTHPSLTQTKL